jgi:hypothetical protein
VIITMQHPATAPRAPRRRVVYSRAMVRRLAWLAFIGGIGCGRVDAVPDAPAPVPDASAADAVLADAALDAAIDAAIDAPGDDGLVAWYRMDAFANLKAEDAVGPHDGVCAASECPAVDPAGKIGGAYVFDGVDDLIRVASTPALETTSAFTVTAWINQAPGTAFGSCVLNKLFGTESGNSWQVCIDDVDGKLFFSTDGQGESNKQFSVDPIVVGDWYHIALWWNGSPTRPLKRFYVNGNRLREDVTTVSFDDAAILIGADIDGGVPFARFPGRIDDVRIYNRALSESEILALQSP